MSDYIVRATAAEGQIRAFAITSRELTEYARSCHNTSPTATAALGRLLSAGAMMGVMMKGEKDTLTLQIRGTGPIGGLTVVSDSHAHVKGYVHNPEVILGPNDQGKLDVAGAIGSGILSVIRDMGLKEPYVGQTELVTSEIGEDLTAYFASSEQIPSAVGLGVLMERNNTVRQAGGFILQAMPFAEETLLARLEEKIAGIASVTAMLDRGMTPEGILEELLGEFRLEISDTLPASYFCDCSKERVARAMVSMGAGEIREMIRDGKPVEAGCHFCGKNYIFSVEALKELLAQAKR